MNYDYGQHCLRSRMPSHTIQNEGNARKMSGESILRDRDMRRGKTSTRLLGGEGTRRSLAALLLEASDNPMASLSQALGVRDLTELMELCTWRAVPNINN